MEDNRFLKIVIIVLLLINSGTLAFMWTRKPPMPLHHPPGGAYEFLTHELNLDENQRKQYAALRDEHHEAVEKLMDSGRALHDKYFELLRNPSGDSLLVQQTAETIAANQKQIELLTFYHFQKVKTLCTPEQQKRFDEVISETLRMMAPAPPGK
jgi:protein CpxP